MQLKLPNSIFIGGLIFLLGFLIFVFPNSFRIYKIPLLLFIAIVGFREFLKINIVVIIFLISSFVFTIIYLLVGIPKSKLPDEALSQVLIVYIYSPLLWSIIFSFVFKKYQIYKIIYYFNMYMVLGCISVFVSLWMYLTGQFTFLEYVIDSPNMTLSNEGTVEMKLFVYGSSIFFFPAFLQLGETYTKKYIFFIIVFLCLITAIVSGRSALLLSFFIGFFFYLRNISIINIITGICLVIVSSTLLELLEINFFNTVLSLIEKVFDNPEDERVVQSKALFNGILENPLGAGHGVGVEYLRSEKFPWRYENLPLAIVFRVGLLGFLIYSLPFIYSLTKFLLIKKPSVIDRYMIVGYISMIMANFTNPYLESFEFNAFYVFPFFYFSMRELIISRIPNSIS